MATSGDPPEADQSPRGDPRLGRGYRGDVTGTTPTGSRGPDECLRCGSVVHSMGVEQFRVGGTSGGWKLLFGEWAELGEDMLKLEVRACPVCRHVETRIPLDR
jgi:hypothetical protein